MIGKTLGNFEITSQLGKGGMGEVYQAKDQKLGRDVAIKVLPEEFARDADRVARFQREAKLLASLNHPNIAAIHGLEESGGTNFLVLELVEGDTLADRIKVGSIPVEESLKLALQIAEALEAAHEKGVIHRDLKPANIKVTPEGKVKVLDFGLAKAFAGGQEEMVSSDSPTLTLAETQKGVILGTAAYMSPEQAKGKIVDKRADIWSFGVVLYEMLTGKQLFAGETISDILAAVIKEEPDWEKVPARVRPLLRHCLEKDPKRRLRDIGDAWRQLESAPESAPAKRPWLAWSVAALCLLVALALGAVAYFPRIPEETRPVRFSYSLPDTWSLAEENDAGGPAAAVALSPNGQRLAFLARNTDRRSLLWIRSLDTLAAQPLAGTEGAASPFWSPDSRFLGFFAEGKIKKIEVSGGPPVTLCDSPNNRGGTWNTNGDIVFSPGLNSALQKVSASGGISIAATQLAQGEATHAWPFFLPDGRHFLYRVYATQGGGPVYLASLDSAERKLLLSSDSANVIYAQGNLLYLRARTLMAQPFDARRLALAGEPVPIAEQVQTETILWPVGVFSASENGVLTYQAGAAAGKQKLTWFDRTGRQISTLGDPFIFDDVELSPDGKRASVSIAEKTSDVWIYDVARGVRTRFTFGPMDARSPVWSPDGSRIVFNSLRKGHFDLYQKASSGAGNEEVLLEDNQTKIPTDWSPDGRFILYTSSLLGRPPQLFVLPLAGDRKPFPLLPTTFNEVHGQFSPDGRWVAYGSNESGKTEVYVAPFPGPGGKGLISTNGGNFPRWRRDGAEIFYLASDGNLMAAAVNRKGSSFEVGAIKSLFQTRRTAQGYFYDVSADGQHFLINTAPAQTTAPITVVLNWTAGLKK